MRFAHWVRAHLLAIQGILTGLWLVAVLPSLLWWSHSIAWVVFMSVWNCFASHAAGWIAALAERDQRADA